MRAAPHAGGVDEHDRPVLGLDERVDRVAGGARHVVHDRAVLADEPVEQRALADVGPADDRDTGRVALDGDRDDVLLGPRVVVDDLQLGRHGLVAEPLEHHVEQVAGAAAVQRAHRRRVAETERQELPQVLLAALVVALVGDHHHLVVAAAQPVGDGLVVVERADARVDDEQHEVGLANGGLDLAADLVVELAAASASSRRCRSR